MATAPPAHTHPDLPRLFEVTARLTAADGPFAVVEEPVLGEPMLVFRDRPRSLREVLVRSFCHGDRDCFVFSDGRRITFAGLEGQVASLAARLRDGHGIGRGDRVAICAANGPGWLLSFWACAALGAVTVAMNGWWTEVEMRHALELTEPSLLLVDAKRRARLGATPGLDRLDLDEVVETIDRPGRPGTGSTDHGDAGLPDGAVDEDDPAILIFTSGTTGRPKAAVLTQRSVVAFGMSQLFIGARSAALAGSARRAGAPPVRLAVFPLFHVSGLGSAVTALLSGGTTVWPLGRFDPGTVIDLTISEGIAAWTGTGAHLLRLLDHPGIDRIDPRQLGAISMGGSATTPAILRACDERFPHLKNTMASGYGSTESGGLATFAPNWLLAAAPDCVGPPLPTVEVRITDDAGMVLPDGEVGNIGVRSPLVMPGYWGTGPSGRGSGESGPSGRGSGESGPSGRGSGESGPSGRGSGEPGSGPTAEVLEPGRWLRTGDYGRIEGGLLFIASRRRDLILRGGENVYPIEIENVLDEHPSILEAAALGVDHDVLGQEVKAIVVVAEGTTLTPDDVRRHCARSLASYKIPAHVEIRTGALPRNASGKVMKHVLTGDAENTFVTE